MEHMSAGYMLPADSTADLCASNVDEHIIANPNKMAQDVPFYLLRDTSQETTLNGSTNLILYNNLQKSFDKYCISKKVKDSLGSFISNFPSNIDTLPNDEVKESSTIAALFSKQIVAKEVHLLTNSQLTAFRLYPGPLPEKYTLMVNGDPTLAKSLEKETSEKKSKKSKKSDDESHEKKKKKKEKKKKKKLTKVNKVANKRSNNTTFLHSHFTFDQDLNNFLF